MGVRKRDVIEGEKDISKLFIGRRTIKGANSGGWKYWLTQAKGNESIFLAASLRSSDPKSHGRVPRTHHVAANSANPSHPQVAQGIGQ